MAATSSWSGGCGARAATGVSLHASMLLQVSPGLAGASGKGLGNTGSVPGPQRGGAREGPRPVDRDRGRLFGTAARRGAGELAWGSRQIRGGSHPGMARAFRSPYLDSVTEDQDDDEARVGPARGDGRGARPRPPEPRDLRLRRPGPGAPAAPCPPPRAAVVVAVDVEGGGVRLPPGGRPRGARGGPPPPRRAGAARGGRPGRAGAGQTAPQMCHSDGDGVLSTSSTRSR